MASFHRSEVHKKKLKKNLAVMGLILGFVGVIWIVSMIKIAGG